MKLPFNEGWGIVLILTAQIGAVMLVSEFMGSRKEKTRKESEEWVAGRSR